MPYTEAQKRATIAYDSKTYRKLTINLRRDSDKDLIEWLESKDSKQATIKEALYEHMKKDSN